MDVVDNALAACGQKLQALRQQNYDPATRATNAFLKTVTTCVTERRSEKTNIIDQGESKTYSFDEENLASLFYHLERCRRAGSVMHFSEKQGSPSSLQSGIMLDFDIALSTRPLEKVKSIPCGAKGQDVPKVLDERAYLVICSILVKALIGDLVIPPSALCDGEFQLEIFFIVRPEVSPLSVPKGSFKYGFHLLVPGVQVSRSYKKYLISELRKNEKLLKVLGEIGAVGVPNIAVVDETKPAPNTSPLEACLDQNSASVPVLFVGSCKRGGNVYPLGAAFQIRGDISNLRDGMGYFITAISDAQLAQYNLCYELSLWARPSRELQKQREGEDGFKVGLVKPHVFTYREELITKVETISDRLKGSVLSQDEFRETEREVSELCRRSPDGEYIQQLLSLLDETYCSDYTKWRNVVFALCNAGEACNADFLPLAQWFSQRCPEKWTAGGKESLEKLWEESKEGHAIRKTSPHYKPLSKRSIIYWAKLCSPDRFKELSKGNYYNALATYIYKHGGVLAHAMIAEVLHMMLTERFVVDTVTTLTSARYIWYEFVSEGQKMRPGEIWKWRVEAEPDELHMFISNKMVDIAEQIRREVMDKQKEASSDEEGKYYKELKKKLDVSINNLYNNIFKKHSIEQARFMFRRRGFIEMLDKDPDILGVANGVIRLATVGRPHTQLISGFHEWPVSRFTTVKFRPFDPTEYWTQLLLDATKKIIPELDMRNWFMMFLATGLYHGLKDPVMLFMVGCGSNAKTFLARMAEVVLGDYATKLPITLLTSEREDASKPNSAVMQSKGKGFIYFEESNKREVLNTSRLKDMVNPGVTNARDLGTKQETFENSATPLSLSNFGFIIETKDDGTWRRCRHYRAKAKFCSRPDPNNPYEHKDDRRFINDYINDPNCQTAFLGIMVYFWEKLQAEYQGSIRDVPCPTLDKETEIYRNSQDVLNRFVTERIVVSPKNQRQYPMAFISGQFCDWYQSNIESGGRRYVASEVIGDLSNSSLSRFLTTTPNGMQVLSGCRFLNAQDATEQLLEEESYIGAKSQDAVVSSSRFGPGGEPEPEKWWEWKYTPLGEDQKDGAEEATATLNEVVVGKLDSFDAELTGELLIEDGALSDGRARRAKEAAIAAEKVKEEEAAKDQALADFLGETTAAKPVLPPQPTTRKAKSPQISTDAINDTADMSSFAMNVVNRHAHSWMVSGAAA